jgi:pSer/pThr/pTyr-binding forkhead associated (FHA) protein
LRHLSRRHYRQPRHAESRREGGEFRLIDVDSLNGTYVNREPIDSADLTNGDEIQMGKVPASVFDRARDGLTPMG